MNRLKVRQDGLAVFYCPGCGSEHTVRVTPGTDGAWQWNGSADMPTLSPSVLVRTGHYRLGSEGDACWCTYNTEHPDEPSPFTCSVCHSFVADGRIQFLADCTHALAGQTVDLPELRRTDP